MIVENMTPILDELLQAQQLGVAVALATVVHARGSVPRHAGSKMLVYEDGRLSGTVGGGEMESRVIAEARQALQDGQARLVPYQLVDPKKGDPGVCGGEMQIYIEPFLPPATVFVVGCGHVGQALAELANWLGYRIAVSDDREELASPDVIPSADIYLPGTIENALQQFKVTRNTFIAVVTRNVKVDVDVLPVLINTPAPYIGVMGSRRRWQTTRRMLLERGVAEQDLQKVHSPLGLELNAESPEEIAVSIMAEIIMLRRHGTGQRMAEEAIKNRTDS